NPISFQDPRGRDTVVRGSSDVLDVVIWLLANYPELFPERELLITQGDPREGNWGVTDRWTGNITIRKGLSRGQLANTVAHELLHARESFWDRRNNGVRQIIETFDAEHQQIERAGAAIGYQFEQYEREKAGLPVSRRTVARYEPGTVFFLPMGR